MPREVRETAPISGPVPFPSGSAHMVQGRTGSYFGPWLGMVPVWFRPDIGEDARSRYRLMVRLSRLMDMVRNRWSMKDHSASGPIYRRVARMPISVRLTFGPIEPLALFQGFEVMDHMVHGPDGPGPFLFRSDIGDDALAPISVGRGPSMALPWAIPTLLPTARHVIGAVARMPISDSWPVVQSCFSTCPSMTGRHCPCLP